MNDILVKPAAVFVDRCSNCNAPVVIDSTDGKNVKLCRTCTEELIGKAD